MTQGENTPSEADEPPGSPELTAEEFERAQAETPLNADTTFEVIRRHGQEELHRPSAALFYSGLAAGLSMGFSLVAEGLLHHYLPDAAWTPLISKLGYSVGFLMITLGSQQLFTENTLTAIIPLLAARSRGALLNVCRLWGVVLLANLIGAAVFALAVSQTAVFEPAAKDAFMYLGVHAAEGSHTMLMARGIFAGWLIAMMVWMLPAAAGGKVLVIILMTYLIGLGGFPHIIAGSTEVMYAAFGGAVTWGDYLFRYAPATLAGNVLGGVALVTALNYAQVVAGGGRRNSAERWLRRQRGWPTP